MFFMPVGRKAGRGTLTIPGSTDNRGNSFVSAKLLTTKFPLVVILMEVAAQCHERGVRPHLHWTPREQNVEADELAAGVTRRFDPARRLRADICTLPFLVLPEPMREGESLYDGLAKVREAKRARVGEEGPAPARKGPKTKLGPW